MGSESGNPKRAVKKCNVEQDNSDDVDTFLQKVIKEEHPVAKKSNMTEMQQAALSVLQNAEQEAKQMDAMINARRNQMEHDMLHPPTNPVKFTVNDDHPIDNLENDLNAAMANINADTSIHPLVSMQKDQSIFTELPKEQAVKPVVKFTTPEVPEFDKKYGPLFSLTAPQRNKLFQQWFKQAVTHVDAHIASNPVSPTTRDRLIREETTRLQDSYLENY